MKHLVLAFISLGIVSCAAQDSPRARITGIDHVAFYTTDAEGVKKLYGTVLGLESAAPIESGELTRYLVGSQWVGFSAAPDPNASRVKGNDRLDHVAFATDNIIGLRRRLIDQGLNPPSVQSNPGQLSLAMTDPEGHRIEFIQRTNSDAAKSSATAVSRHMIHAGFLVYHRDAEDHFYKDILGFRPYWHGGMKDDETDWVAMQVPDGTDWVEYMLNQPANPSPKLSGVMNHISLGVVDIKKAQALLESHGWKQHDDERAQMGKDGKWQLNLYDPDYTRIELMEFKPVQKPCCSDFQGPHPTE